MSKKKIAINILGIKLKEGREKAGLSAEEIAIKLADNGVTVRDINDWENGYEIPKEEIVVKKNSIEIHSHFKDTALINKQLVEAGVLVSAMYSNADSLEEYFMKRIGG